ncbi:MAG: hypothetical protein IPP63_08970 [Chloracidobacterium sp.]|nr:hypothetical protein [Chloracidobacterium sp.]
MNKQLITIIVLVLFSFVLSAQGQDETRSIQTWKVQKYDVSATLPSDAASRSAGFTAVLSLRNISGKSAVSDAADQSICRYHIY